MDFTNPGIYHYESELARLFGNMALRTSSSSSRHSRSASHNNNVWLNGLTAISGTEYSDFSSPPNNTWYSSSPPRSNTEWYSSSPPRSNTEWYSSSPPRSNTDWFGDYSSSRYTPSNDSRYAPSNDTFGYRSTTPSEYGSDSSASSACSSPPASPSTLGAFTWDTTPKSHPLDDFAKNGVDCDLDEIDKIMRRHNLDKNVRSSTLGQGRAAELLETKDPAMMMKSKLLLLIREAERNKLNKRKKAAKVCVFCKNNGECEAVYGCHQIKDDTGRVTCPILYCYKCPKCGADGENAHTLKYCPLTIDTYIDSKAIRSTARTAAGKRRFPSL